MSTLPTYILYASARSSCSWRVRAVLEHKRLRYEYRPISVYGGETHSEEFRAINPAEMVPALIVPGTANGTTQTLFESLAIIDYLERMHPEFPVYPADPIARTQAIAIAEMIVSGIQPLQNSGVMKVYAELNGGDRSKALAWSHYWIETKFDRLETILEPISGSYTVGNQFSIADICLVPQVTNAVRYGMSIEKWPLLKRLYEKLIVSEASIIKARPENQIDFDPNVKSWVDSK